MLSAAAFVGLALFSVVPLAKLLSHTLEHGLVFTGADGLFPADQFQYMSWIRQFGDHLLAANLLDLAPSSHVFLHPQFLLSGLAWRAGVGIQMAFLLWKPIAVMALFFGFRSYVARFLPGTGQRVAAFVAAMFFASPIAALVSWASIGSAHFQYQIAGRLHVVLEDGTEFEAGPGSCVEIPPGHDAYVVGDETFVAVDWQGALNYVKS